MVGSPKPMAVNNRNACLTAPSLRFLCPGSTVRRRALQSPSAVPTETPHLTVAIPAQCVLVIDGGSSGLAAPVCLCPGDEAVTQAGGMDIAAQCCEHDGTCRRFVGTNTNEGCISRKWPNVLPSTYSEAWNRCNMRNLVMCGQSSTGGGQCNGGGCSYDRLPVWTNITCTPTTAPTAMGLSITTS
eukprot:gene9988-biopygen5833